MNSVLNELYNGNINPYELIYPKDPEFCEINEKISDETLFWKSKLTKEEFNRLEDLQNLLMQSSSVELRETFKYGFKLGVMIMIESFTGSLTEQ